MSSDPIDRLEQLERLVRLRDAGALSAAEFEAEKRRVLMGGYVPSAPAAPVPVPSPAPYLPDAGVDAPVGKPWLGTLIRWALAVAIISAVLAYFFINTTPTTVDRKPARTAARVPAPSLPPPAIVPPVTETADTMDMSVRLKLTNPAACTFGREGERVFDALIRTEGDRPASPSRVSIGDLDLAVDASNEADDRDSEGGRRYRASVRFPAGATWNGLKLSRIARTYGVYPDSDSTDERIVSFLEPASAVRAALGVAGIDVPLSPKYRNLAGEGGGRMQVLPIAGGSALICTGSG